MSTPTGDSARQSSQQVIAWRRRALDQQLPAAAFPAGSGAPALVYLWMMMVLATVALLGFMIHDRDGVPTAINESQRDLITGVARTLNTSANSAVEAIDRVVDGIGSPPPADADLLDRVLGDRTEWTGAAIIETASRRSVAAAGASLSLELLPQPLPAHDTVGVDTGDGAALVRSVALDASRTLLALRPLSMRSLRLNPDARHGVFTLTGDGEPVLVQGVAAVDAEHLPEVFAGLAGLRSGTSRTIAVREWPDRQLVVSAAPVGDTGVVIVSLLVGDVREGVSLLRGLLLAATLLVVAGLGFVLMHQALLVPVRALLSRAKAEACGATTAERARLRTAEAHRVGQALSATSGAASAPGRRRLSTLKGVVAAALVTLVWPVIAVATVLGSGDSEVPAQLLHDQESRAESASVTLGNALQGGLDTVGRLAAASSDDDPGAVKGRLSRELAQENRFRGLYLVDGDGRVLSSTGRSSLRRVEPVPGEGGIQLDRSVRRLPVLYAYRQLADGRSVVGEFDIDFLLRLVRRIDGRVRVVDVQLRTVLDSEGYRAFEPLTGATARAVAVAVLPGGTAGRTHGTDGSPTLIAGAGLLEPASVAHLEWAIVIQREVASLQLPEIVAQRWTMLVAGAVAGVVLLTFAWQYYIFVVPLSRLATAADRIRDGHIDEPVTPQRHDDIGAVAMCLEICRQVRHTGSARFGGAVRIRGSERDFTAVLPRVPKQRQSDREARV